MTRNTNGGTRERARGRTAKGNGHDQDEIVLVPVDGSMESKMALPFARLVADIVDVAVLILYVTERPLPQQLLLRQLKLSRRQETAGLIVEQAVGAPAEQILRKAVETPATLIVMTTHGQTTTAGSVLGPVPEQVLQGAPCPVIMVRPENEAQVARREALRRILFPLGGAPSIRAVGLAVDLAEKSGAEIDVLCAAALGERTAEEPGTYTTPRYGDHAEYEWTGWAQQCLELFWAGLARRPTNVATQVFVRHGDPGVEIRNVAVERETDLIVLEWRGSLDPAHAPVVRRILEESPCPVLLLRTAPTGRHED